MPLTPAWALLLWRGHFLTTAWAFSGASYIWKKPFGLFIQVKIGLKKLSTKEFAFKKRNVLQQHPQIEKNKIFAISPQVLLKGFKQN